MLGNLKRMETALKDVETRPKVFINLHGKGLWTCGKNSFLNDLVLKAKGVNIAGDVPRTWFSYNREELLFRNPDYIVVLTKLKKDFLGIKKWFTQEAHLENIQAVQKEDIHYLNEDLVTRQGPRIVQALDRIARILHPASFRDGK